MTSVQHSAVIAGPARRNRQRPLDEWLYRLDGRDQSGRRRNARNRYRSPNQIQPSPTEQEQASFAVDVLNVANAIAVDVRIVAKVQEFHHHCLPCAADIGRNREHARTAAQNHYANMTWLILQFRAVNTGIISNGYGINGHLRARHRQFARAPWANHPIGVPYICHANSAASNHHNSTPTAISARVSQ